MGGLPARNFRVGTYIAASTGVSPLFALGLRHCPPDESVTAENFFRPPMRRHFFLLLIPAASWLLGGCASENLEDLTGSTVTPTCDTTAVTYNGVVKPIIAANCQSCHFAGGSGSTTTPGDTRDFTKYADLRDQALKTVGGESLLVAAVSHSSRLAAFQWMPQSSPKLSDCNIAKIRTWVRAGAPNN